MKANVDLMGQNGQFQGEVAGYLASQGKLDPYRMRPFIGTDGRSYETVFKGGDPKILTNYIARPVNTYATLRRDEWKRFDEAILRISRDRLGGIQDLIEKNLTFTLGNAMGTTIFEWHDVSDSMEAIVSMDGVTRGQGDRPVYGHNYMPLPITHVDYEINLRVLQNSRNIGNAVDTDSAEAATRRIYEKLEDMLFTNTTYSYGGLDARGRNSIYSYINHPDRNQVVLNVAWNAAAATGAIILADVLDMVQSSVDNLHFGPWMLYVPTAYQTVLGNDYDVTTPQTSVRERIMKIDGLLGIKVIDHLPADNILLVQMTGDVVRLIQGMGLQAVEWQTEGKFITKYKVLTIQVPQIRSDQAGKSGIVHLA